MADGLKGVSQPNETKRILGEFDTEKRGKKAGIEKAEKAGYVFGKTLDIPYKTGTVTVFKSSYKKFIKRKDDVNLAMDVAFGRKNIDVAVLEAKKSSPANQPALAKKPVKDDVYQGSFTELFENKNEDQVLSAIEMIPKRFLRYTDNEGNTLLHKAAELGYKKVAEYLIKKGAVVDARHKDNNYKTPLYVAVEKKQYDMVKLLLNKGADVSQPAGNDWNPLYLAAQNNDLAMVKILLPKSNERVMNFENRSGTSQPARTPLYAALKNENREMANLLFSSGANIGAVDPTDKQSAFTNAIKCGSVKLVKSLINSGCKLDQNDAHGHTWLYAAVISGNKEVIDFLLDNGVILKSDDRNLDMLIKAYNCGSEKLVKYLKDNDIAITNKNLNSRDKSGRTPLAAAMHNENYEAAKVLIKMGALVNTIDNDDRTPLHDAIKSNDLELIGLLLDKGAHVNAQDKNDETPLSIAKELKLNDVCSLLEARQKARLDDERNLRKDISNYDYTKQVCAKIEKGIPLYFAVLEINHEKKSKYDNRLDDYKNKLDPVTDKEKIKLIDDFISNLSKAKSRSDKKNVYDEMMQSEKYKNLKNEDTTLYALLEKKGKADLEYANALEKAAKALQVTTTNDMNATEQAVAAKKSEALKQYRESDAWDLDKALYNIEEGHLARVVHQKGLAYLDKYQLWSGRVEKESRDIIEYLKNEFGTQDQIDKKIPHIAQTGVYHGRPDLAQKAQEAAARNRRVIDPLPKYTSTTTPIPRAVVAEPQKKAAGQDLSDNYTSATKPPTTAVAGRPTEIEMVEVERDFSRWALENFTKQGDFDEAKVASMHREMRDIIIAKGMDITDTEIKKKILKEAVSKGSKDLAQYLLLNGVNINETDKQGHTLLHTTAREGNDKALELLIALGAGVNVRNTKGETPLHLAFEVGNLKIIKLLIDNEASMDAKDVNGETPLGRIKRLDPHTATFKYRKVREKYDPNFEKPLEPLLRSKPKPTK